MSLVKELRAASKLFKPEAHAAADYIEQLEKQRDQLLADLATAEQDSRQKQARIDRLERERDELLLALNQIIWKLERKEVVGSKFDGGVRCEFAKIDRNDAVIGLARSAIAAVRGAA